MKLHLLPVVVCMSCALAAAQSGKRAEAEYYAAAYALHFHVPLSFVWALIEQESGWQACPISEKGAAGVMQIMPQTGRQLGVRDPCDLDQNISAGVRYLARLMIIFHGDLRLVAAAYIAGERRIQVRGLSYTNRGVIAYVDRIRTAAESPRQFATNKGQNGDKDNERSRREMARSSRRRP